MEEYKAQSLSQFARSEPPMLATPLASSFASVLIGIAALGPLMAVFEFAFDFLPSEYAAVQNLHSADLLAKWLWIGCGPFGVVAMTLLRHRPFPGFMAASVFAAAYLPAAVMIWGYFTPGCWTVLLATASAAFGALMSGRAGGARASEKTAWL